MCVCVCVTWHISFDLPTVVNTVQQKNMEPKKSQLSGLWSQMDLNPRRIFVSICATKSLCAPDALPENGDKQWAQHGKRTGAQSNVS